MRDEKPLAALTEQVCYWDPDILEFKFAVIAERVAHGTNHPFDVVARCIRWDGHGGEFGMTLFIRLGFTKDGGESGLIRAGGEPFVAIDYPLIPPR